MNLLGPGTKTFQRHEQFRKGKHVVTFNKIEDLDGLVLVVEDTDLRGDVSETLVWMVVEKKRLHVRIDINLVSGEAGEWLSASRGRLVTALLPVMNGARFGESRIFEKYEMLEGVQVAK